MKYGKLNCKRNSNPKFPTHAGFVNNTASMTADMLGERLRYNLYFQVLYYAQSDIQRTHF